MHRLVEMLPTLLNGLGVAVQLLVAVMAVGALSGTLVASMHLSRNAALRWLGLAYDLVFRGFPPIVLLLIVYYAFTQWAALGPFGAATVALGLRSGAYQGRIFEGAITSVPANQYVAGRSIGLSAVGTYVRVLVPQAIRHALGPWANEMSTEFKLTSIAFVVGVVELTRQAKYLVNNAESSMLVIFALVAALYYVVNASLFLVIRAIERRIAMPGFEAGRGDGGQTA